MCYKAKLPKFFFQNILNVKSYEALKMLFYQLKFTFKSNCFAKTNNFMQ